MRIEITKATERAMPNTNSIRQELEYSTIQMRCKVKVAVVSHSDDLIMCLSIYTICRSDNHSNLRETSLEGHEDSRFDASMPTSQ